MHNKTPLIAGLTACAAIFGTIWHCCCGISAFALVDTGDSSTNLHADSDIRQAVSAVRDTFSDYHGCIMHSIRYLAAESKEEASGCYMGMPIEEGSAVRIDDVIVLDSAFSTGIFADDIFCRMPQEHWKWIVVHTPENGWKVQSGGYG